MKIAISRYLALILTLVLPVAGRPADTSPAGTARPLLSRADLGRLKTLDPTELFAALGSFDDRGLSEAQFVLRTATLLDPARVPGLTEALAAGDAPRVLEVVMVACKKGQPAAEPADDSAAAIDAADKILAHRFSFYGEEYQLPESIDWDANPGTAHWGHDLNRFSYLNTLTRAWQATGDVRYSRKAVALILDWIGKCDFGKCFEGTPYVFGSYLNNAIHCEAWCRCLDVLLPAGQVEPIELLHVLKSLHDQLAYLEVVT
ncbi:MAG: heparinase II/III family protein, partial [Thermoguttaceae bacterium]